MRNSKSNHERKHTILVCDDTEFNRAIVAKIFQDTSCKVLQASNGLEALDVMHTEDVDLILLDIQMPVMNGYEVIGVMKQDEDLCQIPIVVTTGAIDKSERKAFDLGADEFITQPYDPYILRKRVENLIDRYELQEMKGAAREQERYQLIFEVLNLAYWEWSQSQGYYENERFKQYGISEVPKETRMIHPELLFDYIDPRDHEIMREYMKTKDAISHVIVRCKKLDGTFCWTELFTFIERDANGTITRFASSLRDVDSEWGEQKRQLEMALKQSQEANLAKTAFLSRISHDMRTPLNGMLGLNALLKSRTSDPSMLHDLSEMELSGNYLLNLINDTLDVSRIEAGKLELHPIVCEGKAVTENLLSMIHQSAKEKNIEIQVDARLMSFTSLYVDVNRLEQLFMNIMGNAIKFSQENGKIEVTAETQSMEDGYVTDRFTIQDHGIGMKKEFVPKIFEAFSQEDMSKTTRTQGTGLGMHIVKQIVDLMHGSIEIESEENVGTKVTMVLPLQVATQQQLKEASHQAILRVSDANLFGKRILLAEDHPLNAEIATRLLQNKGMRVERAENGQEAVDRFIHSAPSYYDAILMDIRMPIMDGLEATRTIRRLTREDAHTIPILAMTANAYATDIEETRNAGMNAHLSKPINTDQLYETLQNFLTPTTRKQKVKLLIVDDSEINRGVLIAGLEADYQIFEAEDGQHALEVLEQEPGIAGIITDLQMPNMDGFELIRRVRKEASWANISIIASTQYGDSKQEEELLSMGVNEFVYKPANQKLVELRVRNALKKL